MHTWKADRGAGTYAIWSASDYRIGDDLVALEVVQLRIEIGLLTKEFVMMNSKKVNSVGEQGSASKSCESNMDEEAKY